MTQVDFDDIMREYCTNDETLEELKAAAFEVLRLNPGCEQSDWAKILVEQYGTEVVDAYGKDPSEAYASLEDLWESPYLDEVSGLEYDFKTWAEAFSTDAAVPESVPPQAHCSNTPASGCAAGDTMRSACDRCQSADLHNIPAYPEAKGAAFLYHGILVAASAHHPPSHNR